MKKYFALILAIVMSLSLVACGQTTTPADNGDDNETADPLNIVFSINEYAGEPQEIWMDAFAENIDKLSNGAIVVEKHYVGELGEGSDLIELIQSNVVNMGACDCGPTSVVVPEVGIMALHWMMPNNWESLFDFLDNATCIKMFDDLYNAAGLNIVSWETEGANLWTADREIHTPADFKGFNMRTMENTIIQESFKAYGANATVIAFSELYSALQLGTVDGQENPASVIMTNSYNDVQDYLIQGNADWNFFTIVTNSAFEASLTQEQKDIINQASAAASAAYREKVESNEKAALDELVNVRCMKFITLTDEEAQAFKDMSGSVRELYVKNAKGQSQAILDQFLKDLENYK